MRNLNALAGEVIGVSHDAYDVEERRANREQETEPHSRRRAALALLALAALLLGSPLAAQGAPGDSALQGPLLTRSSAWIAGGTLLAAGALMAADRGITDEFRDPGPQGNGALRAAARDFNWLGDPGTVVLSVAMYGSGRLLHHSTLAEMGLRGAEALAISAVATGVIKGLAGRNRPYLDNGDPDSFVFGQGFGHGGRTSFPSGHATAAFALASVVASEASFRWPHASRYVGPLVYGAAASVALARVYSDKHWASDVVAGAGIGTLTGLAVVRYHRLHPHSRLDRLLLGVRVTAPAPGRFGLAWSAPAP